MKHTALHQNPSSIWPHQPSRLPRHDVYEISGLLNYKKKKIAAKEHKERKKKKPMKKKNVIASIASIPVNFP